MEQMAHVLDRPRSMTTMILENMKTGRYTFEAQVNDLTFWLADRLLCPRLRTGHWTGLPIAGQAAGFTVE